MLFFLSFLTMLSKDKPLWVDFLQMAIPVGLAVWGFVRAYKAWERQKKREIDLHLEQKRFESKLEACKGVWPLLAYLSAWENEKTVFIKRKDKYYFRKPQGQDYLKKLPETFYDQGYGVFIPSDARDGLYHFRSIVYKLLQSSADSPSSEDIVEVKNLEMAEKAIPEIFKKINTSLRGMLLDTRIDFSE